MGAGLTFMYLLAMLQSVVGDGGGESPIIIDTTPPVITLIGSSEQQHEQGLVFNDLGATAFDDVDGDLPVETIGSVGSAPGTYTLTYSATDLSGNSATATRTVIVEATDDLSETLVVFAEGEIGPQWNRGVNAFDEALDFGECNNDGGSGCPSIDWQIVSDAERGDVLEIEHASTNGLAGVFISSAEPVDVSQFASLIFDVRVISGDSQITMKLDCFWPCTSGDQALGERGASGWEEVTISLASLGAQGLVLDQVNTGLVIWASESNGTVFRIDNVRFSGEAGEPAPGPSVDYALTSYGAGTVSDTINPQSYRCVVDYGNWIYNAGVVEPGIAGCNEATGVPIGTPTPLLPKLTGPAADKPTPSHRWWGSIPFLGEMQIDDASGAAYITPDPITARITDRGFRAMGIPSGLAASPDNGFGYAIPSPFSEVFDGVAIGHSSYRQMSALLHDHSDGAVTVEWQHAGETAMTATFVHGSPYVYIKAFDGEPVLRTLRADGGEKGIFFQGDNSLGVWTDVAGNRNYFLLTGEGQTQFLDIASNEIAIENATREFTLTWLPFDEVTPNAAEVEMFERHARDVVSAVEIDYVVDPADYSVTVSRQYLDERGQAVTTLAGLHPLHWKRSVEDGDGSDGNSGYETRSARGVIKFRETDAFSYQLPSVGVLPALPTLPDALDVSKLTSLIDDFVSQGNTQWNTYADTYWSGKRYGRVAEVAALADMMGMTDAAQTLTRWLKSELEDWFIAERAGQLDSEKYFVYDDDWNTLLGMEESFAAHQQLNDHHFHYGYFVRAAAEVCRQDPAWCGPDQYGPMVELLIRDYAADDDDPLFPATRNFDPANGFSWASGPANFVRGNNNESTSEAANAYGAIVLYGLVTGRQDLVERGTYLHASTAATYWEYWNNIDGYENPGRASDNFPAGYDRITTSIIWGDGSAFSTWFSPAFAHILGIQGLPLNPLVMHVGQYADYMADYVQLGLAESNNIKPSGLPDDQWRDIWWGLWSMTDAEAAISDYNSLSAYVPEEGSSRAHTYHWIHTLQSLGHLQSGTLEITADYPAAMVFNNRGQTSYVVYNFGTATRTVTFSNGVTVEAAPNRFTVISY